MMKQCCGITLVVVLIISLGIDISSAQIIPFDSGQWQIEASESTIETFKGKQSLLIKDGRATLNDFEFLNGVIEFDIAFPLERGFTGVFWRAQDARNLEHFYMRPHQSGNPDANQYTPVFNGVSGWQLYHGEGYGSTIKYPHDAWFHVKVVVSDRFAEIYIQDMDSPALVTVELMREKMPGMIGITNAFVATRFANFKITKMEKPALKGTAPKPKPAEPEAVMSWLVSSPVAENILTDPQLESGIKSSLKWQRLNCEITGTLNLARLYGRRQETNTVFAKLIIDSEQEQIKRLAFGYSDKIRVFLNDRQLYAGDNGYQSRDYRYLGTIGYFDSIFLPLRKGRNELWMAVSENFGGWGIQAKFDDLNGIELN